MSRRDGAIVAWHEVPGRRNASAFGRRGVSACLQLEIVDPDRRLYAQTPLRRHVSSARHFVPG